MMRKVMHVRSKQAGRHTYDHLVAGSIDDSRVIETEIGPISDVGSTLVLTLDTGHVYTIKDSIDNWVDQEELSDTE